MVYGDGKKRITANRRIWLECDGKPLLGRGRYELLKAIEKTNSIKEAAMASGICEKTAHNYIGRIESRFGQRVISSRKGGSSGGGSTQLTAAGKMLIRKFESMERKLR